MGTPAITGPNWVQRGSTILTEGSNDEVNSVAMNLDGSVVAFGAWENSGGAYQAGHMRVFAFDGSNYVQRGFDFDGQYASDWSGSEISLSNDGSRVAMGAPACQTSSYGRAWVWVSAWIVCRYVYVSM